VEAVVLKVGETTARVRIVGETDQVTVRMSSYDAWSLVPGQIATVLVGRRWTWRGDPYASGSVEGARIDIPKLGLDPLPLMGGDLDDVADWSEPYEDDDDPYTGALEEAHREAPTLLRVRPHRMGFTARHGRRGEPDVRRGGAC